MTAEIAVMNREAIALAADSAVTLDFSSGPKVFSSANKIFALSAQQPVGVMVFGGASFVGMPWETIIKEVRAGLGTDALPTVAAYNDLFFAELLKHDAFSGAEVQTRSFVTLVGEAFQSVLSGFLDSAENEIEAQGGLNKGQLSDLLTQQIEKHRTAWTETDPLAEAPPGLAQLLRRRYAMQVKALREEVFEQLPLSRSAVRTLSEIAGLVFTKRAPRIADLNYSGIVIAGFGSDEYFLI